MPPAGPPTRNHLACWRDNSGSAYRQPRMEFPSEALLLLFRSVQAPRVSQKVGQKENPSNFLLMHAMGPNVSGVIGSAVAAGVLLTLLK